MLLDPFLHCVLEIYLSFCSEILDGNRSLIYLCVLWLLFLLSFVLVGFPSPTTFRKNEHRQKRQRRVKRRRKGGTVEGHRYHQREEEEKNALISILKSPSGQHYDTNRFRHMLCPDPSCEVCNNATTEMEHLLISLAQEDATVSVSSLASTATVTKASFTQSPASSTVSSGDLMPSLPKPFPPPASITPHNSGTSFGDFLLLSQPSYSQLPDPSLLEAKFSVDPSPTQTFASPPVPPHDAQNEEPPLTLRTIFFDSSIIQDINVLSDLAQAVNLTDCHVPSALSISPPPDFSLTVTQSKSMYILSEHVQETSSPDGPVAVPTSGPQSIDHLSLPISDVSCWETPVIDSLPSTLAPCDFNQEPSFKDVEYDSKKDLGSPLKSQLGENLLLSGQRQMKNVLNVHLSKKFEEINENRLPGTVRSSCHAINQTLSGKSHLMIKQRSLPPPVSPDSCPDMNQEMLEVHISNFHRRMLSDLPDKVFKAAEIFNLKGTSSHFSFESKSSSSNHLTSEVDSNTGSVTPLRGTSKSVHGDDMKIRKSAVILEVPLPATSLVDKEEQGTLRHLPSDIHQGLAEEAPHSPVDNIHPPMLHTSQTGAGHKPMNQSVKTMPSVSTAEELDDLQSRTDDILEPNKPTISVKGTNEHTTVTTERPSEKISVHQNPNLELKKRLMAELKSRSEAGRPNQAQGQHSAMSHDSDRLAYKASLTPAQPVSSVDTGASQALQVQSEDRGVRIEQQQEPVAPKHVLELCQANNFPPVVKNVSPTASRPGERGRGDAGLGKLQAQRKKLSTRDVTFKETLGSKCPQTLSQKGQPPPESLFRNKVKYFFQSLHPGIKSKKQEPSQEKSSPLAAQSRGAVKSTAVFFGTRDIVRTVSKILEEKVGRQHATDVTCPQQPLRSEMKFWKVQEKSAVQAWAGPVEGQTFNPRSPRCKVMSSKFCHQAAVFDGQSSTNRQIKHEVRHPQKVVALKDQQLCQKYPQPVSRSGPMPHPSTTCRPQAAQGPPTALTSAVGTAFRDWSLSFRQKTVLQNVQGKKIPTPK